jgi:integrase
VWRAVRNEARRAPSGPPNPSWPAIHLVTGLVEGPGRLPHPRAAGLTADEAPYDLRHSGVTWRLNSGVPPAEIAVWAGHSVEMLMRTYARCVTGMEDVWITRIDKTLHPEEDQ